MDLRVQGQASVYSSQTVKTTREILIQTNRQNYNSLGLMISYTPLHSCPAPQAFIYFYFNGIFSPMFLLSVSLNKESPHKEYIVVLGFGDNFLLNSLRFDCQL